MSRVLRYVVGTINVAYSFPCPLNGLDISGILGNYVWEASEYFYLGIFFISLLGRSFQSYCSMFVGVYCKLSKDIKHEKQIIRRYFPPKLSLR